MNFSSFFPYCICKLKDKNMKIISWHNKKDFYDYSGFGYDTSDDITYIRTPEHISYKTKLFDNYIPRCFNHSLRNVTPYQAIVNFVIVGIYPYCYFVPYVTGGYFTSEKDVIIPFEIIEDRDKINSLLKQNGSNLNVFRGVYYNKYLLSKANLTEKQIKLEQIFKELECPTFLYFCNGDSHRFINQSHSYANGAQNLLKNVIFNELNINVLKYIQEDLDNRPIYNDIENFLWSIKQEPITEPDNKTKIINHGFDLKTSFRKM